MTATAGTPQDEVRRALEAEREFLLRSLDDLDDERRAGNIDDETYARLHGDYTARAAAVLRSLRDGVDERPVAPPVSARRRVLTVVGIVAFAAVVGIALAFGLGARLPGQGITGRSPETTSAAEQLRVQRRTLQAAVDANPNDPARRLALARLLLAQRAYADALRQFDAAAQLEPTNPEPVAYGGWIVRLAGLPDDGLIRIDRAIAIDPQYADAHFFKGIILLRDRQDPAAAIPELQLYLAARPDGPQSDAVRGLLQQAVEATGGVPSTTVPSTTTAP